MKTPIKTFLRKDIKMLLDIGEDRLAFNMLIRIMDTVNTAEQVTYDSWYNIADYCYDYSEILYRKKCFSKKEKNALKKHMNFIDKYYWR